MKTERLEELIVKWVDHSLTGAEKAEFDAALEVEPSLQGEVQKMLEIKSLLETEIPSSVEPPYPDFFNSQLMRKIDLNVAAQQPKAVVKRSWQALRFAWLPAAALALVLSFLAGQRLGDSPKSGSSIANTGHIPSVYFSEAHLEADVISDSDGDVSAILVDGLSELNDKGAFATATAGLPVSYQRYEAHRFQ